MIICDKWIKSSITCLWILYIQLLREAGVDAHGRLMDPPARNSMWRFGFPNPVNYNDNELYCGGYAVQWEQNGGKCGVCGDAYNSQIRAHEAGGIYAKGIIGRTYTAGQEIDVEVELTSNHWGRFEMALCPNNNPRYEATQACFDRFPLFLSGTRRENRYLIPTDAKKKDIFHYKVRLPPYVTCSQCVLQWTYYTGNMWGRCPNGTEAVGCGKAETFRNCADVRIVTGTSGLPPQFVSQFQNPFAIYLRDFKAPELSYPLVVRNQFCIGNRLYRAVPGVDKWCTENCLRYPTNCPEQICHCPNECTAIGEYEGRAGADEYCQDKCLVYGSECPHDRCYCYYNPN
nr:PREDICTED: uncharacterized protein LOC109041033 isoform X1 [Bemisia tabaci]